MAFYFFRKGKASDKTKGTPVPAPQKRIRPTRVAAARTILDIESSEDSEDENDATFLGPNEESSDDEDDQQNCSLNSSNAEDCSEESSGIEEDEEEEEEGEVDDDDDSDCRMRTFTSSMREEPGTDSGCTAVVALLHGDKLYVANAGDSRCIVCRDGELVY